MAQHTKHRLIENEDLAPLIEIIQFLSRNWKFLGLVTVALSAIAIAHSWLSPKQYQKQLTLSVKPSSIPLSVQPFPAIDVHQTGALAVEFLESFHADEISATAQYNAETQNIALNLQSPNASSLNTVAPKVVSQLNTKFQQPLSQTLASSLMVTELQLSRQKQTLAQFQQFAAEIPPTSTPKLQALEAQQANSVATIAALQFDKHFLQQGQKNLADLTAKVMPVQILSESEVQQPRSSGQQVVIAVIGSFIAAVVAVIIRNQIPQLKSVLSKGQIDRDTDL
ncbi:hypothetical protein H6F98_13915 [Microcoleus sp. FACHB-SPT15]|uniref:hypothetical protein n=1 Tax=Microcoleus sp. FACHB-SPT15 TaxID=2692830 RepID=UPI00177BE767|nr:hypothetical protein [Microcoleus sp. FACHB-SPT15]MBD1806543.1 hypothetical protein [Microcoleus sp. FACHB-SPT15]